MNQLFQCGVVAKSVLQKFAQWISLKRSESVPLNRAGTVVTSKNRRCRKRRRERRVLMKDVELLIPSRTKAKNRVLLVGEQSVQKLLNGKILLVVHHNTS